MAETSATLLLDWELLSHEVVPRLAQGVAGGRRARSWSVGSVEDAASVVIAYASGGRGSSDNPTAMESYASSPGDEVGFRPRDLRAVPDRSRQEYFVHDDRRWLVDERIARRVLLDDPPDVVDLVTFRCGCTAPGLDAAAGRVRQDGQILVIGEPQEALPDWLERVAAGASGVVYRKRTPASGSVAPVGSGGREVETLASHREQQRRIEHHTKLARSLARRFSHRGESADDLEQVAMLALIKAAKRFDPERNTRFVTYATVSILGELKRHFRDKSWTMRVPRQLQESYLAVKKAREELTHEFGADPTVEQIAEHLDVTVETVSAALGAGENFWASSLEGRYEDGETMEIPVVDGSYDVALDRLQMQSRLSDLDERERFVLTRLYFGECTQRELATEMGISQMHISRLQAKALSKLRA